MTKYEIRPATTQHAPDFAALTEAYPYKRFQQKTQGIDRARLNQFLAEGHRATLADPKNAAWIVRQNTRPVAGAILSPNDWHGGFYGLKMGRCAAFLSYEAPRQTTPLLCAAMLDEAQARGLEHLSVRIDGDENQNLHLLEERGFRLIDCSVKLGAPILPDAPAPPPGIQIRPYRESDRDAILRISASSHDRNHYYNDEALDRPATEALFQAWVDRCLKGLAAHVFVAENPKGETVGFVTYLVNRRLNEKLALRLLVLDYVALDRSVQGHGAGTALMSHSLAALAGEYDLVELRTSHNNYPALASYAKYGFRVLSTDFLLHRRNPTPANPRV